MVNLNGHEAGNGGYRQGEPKATTPLLYSTLPLLPEALGRALENGQLTQANYQC